MRDTTAAAPERRPLSVRAYLLILAVTVLLPLLMLAGLLTWRATGAEQARTEEALAATADGVLTVVDREVTGLVETLQTLEAAPSLTAGDLAGFHAQAVAFSRISGIVVILRDAAGAPLLHSRFPWGALPSATPGLGAAEAAAMAQQAPVVSGLVRGAVSGEPGFVLLGPVQREDGVRFLLQLLVPATRLAEVLGAVGVDPGVRLVVVDQAGLVLARSVDHAATVGRRAALAQPGEAPAMRVGRGQDHEGNAVFYHLRRTRSGWTVVTAVMARQIEEPRRRALVNAGIAALLLTGAALLSARLLGTRLATAIRGLAVSASALDRGEPVRAAPSGIREIDEVAGALSGAGERLRLAAEQREAAAEQQRLILHELNHRVKNTLAMVQALAALAARDAPDVATYRDRLTERLHGLARTQSLLTDAEWTGAQLEELLRTELAMYEDPPDPGTDGVPGRSRIDVGGPPVRLPAHQVVAFGMLVHELATNAAKYGALSLPTGRLAVRWTMDPPPPAAAAPRPARLELVWDESGGPPTQPPARKGFGTQMIERGLARQLGAEVEAAWRPEGLRFRLAMPLAPIPQPPGRDAAGRDPAGTEAPPREAPARAGG